MTRIVCIIPSVTNIAAGPSYSVVRLCEALIEEGFQVTLLDAEYKETANTQLKFLKRFKLGAGPMRLGRSPDMLNWLKVNNKEIDIIHNHSLWMMPNVYAGWVASKYNKPLVVSPRGTLSQWAMSSGSSIKKIFWPLLQRPSLRKTVCFHATAYSEYEDIRKQGFKQPVAIIPNGIDIPPIYQKTTKSKRTLLFLGRIHPVKGIDILLNAWSVLEKNYPNWVLKIVGPDNNGYLNTMKQLAKELNLQNVIFHEAIFGEQKLQAYNNADLFVLPSHTENFGVAVAESLASGTPVIVTKGTPWQVVESVGSGWWIDIGKEALVNCLQTALSLDDDILMRMGQNGRKLVEENYSWSKVGQMMAKTYNWVLNGSSKPEWVLLD